MHAWNLFPGEQTPVHAPAAGQATPGVQLLRRRRRRRQGAAEAGVAQRGVRTALHPRARLIAETIDVAAQVRTAAHHALLQVRIRGIDTVLRPARVDAALLAVAIGVGAVEVLAPFPDVAR